MLYSRSSYSSLPSKAGIYVFLDAPTKSPLLSGEGQGEVLYVGKANSLKSRVSSYFLNKALLGERTKLMVSQIKKIKVTVVESEIEALLLEAFYIKKYKPKYNIRLTDSKSYLRIRITIKDIYPKILLSRREDDPTSIYFGPYPSASAVRMVLKIIRKIFPFQSVPNHPKRICLYNHLGLCPCPSVNDSPELRREYRKNIRGIIRVLEGESKKIMKELEKQRDALSKKESYEDALEMQKKIKALSVITEPFRQPFEYDVNPNLRTDIRQKEMDELMEALNKSMSGSGFPLLLGEGQGEVRGGITKLERIECYDISNIQGTNATGSMVVFVNGEKESSQYRKFKIRRDWEKKKTVIPSHSSVIPSEAEGSHATKLLKQHSGMGSLHVGRDDKQDKPNDFAMMKEVLKRRFKHDEWDTPDLVIVDGGKGQVSAALEILGETNIPLIGLAKREETIIIPIQKNQRHGGKGSDETKETNVPLLSPVSRLSPLRPSQSVLEFIEISLPKNSPALQLITRIRDEAHRFAITYHRHLRSKAAVK